jgi:hypothetical protein
MKLPKLKTWEIENNFNETFELFFEGMKSDELTDETKGYFTRLIMLSELLRERRMDMAKEALELAFNGVIQKDSTDMDDYLEDYNSDED